MKNFDVYKHPVQGYEAVKKGFSWPAFFFSWIWAFIKKLWGYGLLFLVIAIFLSATYTHTGSAIILNIGFYIFCGAIGNELRRGNLTSRGYERIETLQAETSDAAIASVVKSNEA